MRGSEVLTASKVLLILSKAHREPVTHSDIYVEIV